ncbi:MAG TPA: C39 family peptidase [Terracidiphilus sp.]|nr:C39 family peptidase [Terracidiphilus sp.]
MKRAAVLCAVLALPAAALRAQDPKPVWIDVPYVHQSPEGCGAAALAMLTGYWAEQQGLAGGFSDGTPAQREQARADHDMPIIVHDLAPRPGRGIAARAMQKYLEEHGYIAFSLQGTWHDLQSEISKGRPLIVALRPKGDPQLHYVVVAGVDPVRSLVIMNDPGGRKLIAEERAEFEKDWSATHNWLLLAVPETSRLPENMQRP